MGHSPRCSRWLAVLVLMIVGLSAAWAQTTPSSPKLAGPVVTQPVTVSWQAAANAARYWVQVSTSADFFVCAVDNNSVTGTSFTLPTLAAGTPYFWRVKGISSTGTQGEWSPAWTFTTAPVAVPATAPTLVEPANGATNLTTSPRLRWNEVAGATAYRVQVSTSSTFTTLLVNKEITTLYTDLSELSTNTTYYWKVAALDSAGTGPFSAVWSFTTTASALPGTPTPVSPLNGAVNLTRPVTVSWSAVSSATRYRVQVAVSSGFTSTVYASDSITATSVSVSGLMANTTYYWRVQAINAAGSGTWSAVWKFTTISEITVAPSTPVLSSPTNGAINVTRPVHLTWNAVTNAGRYQIQVSTESSFVSTVYASDSITTTAVDVSGLLANTTYYWRVKAINTAGSSAWSTAWYFKTATEATTKPTTAPTLVTPANNATGASTSPRLTWNAVTGATGYTLQMSTANDFSTFVVNKTYTGTVAELTGLALNTLYYWRVQAFNSAGEGPWSSVWSFRTMNTLAAPTPSAPANGATVTQPISLSWTPPASGDALTYTVQVWTVNAIYTYTVYNNNAITTTSVQLPSLSKGVKYYWKVKARTASVEGPWSATWSFSTAL